MDPNVNSAVFKAFIAVYQEQSLRQERFQQEERIRQAKKAISEALDAMYEKLNVFDGYDAEGYLECYNLEMTN